MGDVEEMARLMRSRRIFERNQPYAVAANSYLTRLSGNDEANFMQWVKDKNIPFDPSDTADYDMRGFYQALMAGDPIAKSSINQNDGMPHFPDHFKTPYHESFSRESKFATDGAPSWNHRDQLVMPDGLVVFDEVKQNTGMSKLMNDVLGGK